MNRSLGRAVVAAVMLAFVTLPLTATTAFPLVVAEARGLQLKPGARIESGASVTLKPGDRLVALAPDGRVSILRGPYQGPAFRGEGPAQDPRLALAALISTRNDRASSVGAVRSGANAAKLPEPWLIDVSRPGERCIREGDQPVWWRPDTGSASAFTVYPVDRSWRAEFHWPQDQQAILARDLVRLDGMKMLVIRTGSQERPIRLHVIPSTVEDPLVMAAWMLEKACVQQADALLRQIEDAQGPGSGSRP